MHCLSASNLLFWFYIWAKGKRSETNVTCEVRDAKRAFSLRCSVDLVLVYVDEKCLVCQPSSSYADRRTIHARAAQNKNWSVRFWDVELELSQRCLVDLNIYVCRRKCPACQLPSFYSDRDITQARAVKQFEMLDLSWVSAVQWTLIDENALPVSFKSFILIELSPKRKCLKHFSCQVREVELELSQRCSMDHNIDVPRLKRFACQRPKS